MAKTAKGKQDACEYRNAKRALFSPNEQIVQQAECVVARLEAEVAERRVRKAARTNGSSSAFSSSSPSVPSEPSVVAPISPEDVVPAGVGAAALKVPLWAWLLSFFLLLTAAFFAVLQMLTRRYPAGMYIITTQTLDSVLSYLLFVCIPWTLTAVQWRAQGRFRFRVDGTRLEVGDHTAVDAADCPSPEHWDSVQDPELVLAARRERMTAFQQKWYAAGKAKFLGVRNKRSDLLMVQDWLSTEMKKDKVHPVTIMNSVPIIAMQVLVPNRAQRDAAWAWRDPDNQAAWRDERRGWSFTWLDAWKGLERPPSDD